MISNNVPVDLRERLEVLFWQETTCYKTEDYIAAFQRNLISSPPSNPPPTSSFPTQGAAAFGLEGDCQSEEHIKEHWRELICEWAYNLVDHFDLPRERVAVFTSILDRYLQKYLVEHPEGLNKRHFQLLSLTCLYITIKLECRQGFLSMEMMIHLSREKFCKAQMVDMEKEVFRALEWKLHPPTTFVFMQHFLLLLAPVQPLDHDIIEAARFSLELAVLDYSCIDQRPSRVALAAMLNAMEPAKAQHPSTILARHYDFLLCLIAPSERVTVDQCRVRLMELGNSVFPEGSQVVPTVPQTSFNGRIVSPVCVADDPSLIH